MKCPKCSENKSEYQAAKDAKNTLQKYGSYRRKSDGRSIQRFKCKKCQKTYSHAQKDPAYRQKKRRENYLLRGLLSSAVSLRRSAKLLNISRTTAARKLIFLAEISRAENQKTLEKLGPDIQEIQFDELQTSVHTKCKPVSIATFVSAKTRKIIAIGAAQMPATGHLAKISRKKYGPRPDKRQKNLSDLLKTIQGHVKPSCTFSSDLASYYQPVVAKLFPEARHDQFKGERAHLTGLGELKKNRRDPLFWINHTLAMLRANINRLVRKTWCTTKKIARLNDHLAIYVAYHNAELTA